jgi:hypothetical protein
MLQLAEDRSDDRHTHYFAGRNGIAHSTVAKMYLFDQKYKLMQTERYSSKSSLNSLQAGSRGSSTSLPTLILKAYT